MLKFCSAVLFVTDIKVSRQFYEGILQQTVKEDFGECVGFSSGFSLWQQAHAFAIMGKTPSPAANDASRFELYFETDTLDDFRQKLIADQVPFVHDLIEQPWGQRVFRVYDPDRHIVELGEPMTAVISRFLTQGLSVAETAQRTFMPREIVEQVAAGLK